VQPLQKKINLIFVAVAVCVFVLVVLISGVIEYRRVRAEFSSVMGARINVARALMKNTLSRTDKLVQSLIQDIRREDFDELVSRLDASMYFGLSGDSFYILDHIGKVVQISRPYAQYKGVDFSAMVTTGYNRKNHTYHHFQSLLTKESVVTIQYPLYKKFILVIERGLGDFISIMKSFSRGALYDGEQLFVLSEKGRVIYHPDESLMTTRYNLGFDLRQRTELVPGSFFTFSYHGKEYISIKENFGEPAGWIIYYSVPSSVMSEAVKKVLWHQIGFLLFLFLLIFSLIHIVFIRFFSRPVKNIVGALGTSRQENGLFLESFGISGGILEFKTIVAAIQKRDEEVANTVERFQAVLDSLDALVYVSDLETYELLFMNSYAQNICGQCIGQKCYVSFHRGDEPCEFCTNKFLVNEHGEPNEIYVWEYQSRITGQWFECRDQAIRWTDGRLVRMEIATDITGRKQVEEALLAEKERLSVTLRSIGDGVITTDVEGKILFLNKVAEELTGWCSQDAKGRPSTEVFRIINEKTGKKCASPVQRVMELGRIVGLANHTALIARDGSVRSIADSGAPIRDRESRIIGVVLVFRDITNEKKMEEELLKVRKLESVGVLAGGIAHDFNNILSAILGNIELAGFRLKNGDGEAETLLAEARRATKRATKLTRQLLTFSKGGEPIREAASLPELIMESADFILRGSQVVCRHEIPEDLWLVDMDSGQISQVIQNIILNAKHAMPEGGTITVCCANVEDPAREALLSVDKGCYVRITLADTGVGIPGSIINKIFDPYFSTKQEGSGLGLAICYSIINKHDGFLLVNSNPGKGAMFTIYLPAIITRDEKTAETIQTSSVVKAARIMVMDDDSMLRELARSQLQALGHTTILVPDGEQAVNKYQELQDDGRPVDIVIMDLTIPGGMGGQEAARRLLRLDAEAKIIVASGYSNDPVLANYREYGFCAAVAKPFDLAELSKVIEYALTPVSFD
jgi:PAS domain S-box-containing protein